MMMNLPSDETILIIKPGAIGDVLHMTPVVRAIRKGRPNARILFLVASDAAYEILKHNPFVDKIIQYEKGRGVGEINRIITLAKSLKISRLDWVLNYQPSNWRWRLLSLLLRPKGIIKYKKQKRIKPGERILHAVEDHLRPLAMLDIKPDYLDPDLINNNKEIMRPAIPPVYPKLDFKLSDDETKEGMDLLKSFIVNNRPNKRLIGLNLGASHPVNRWPIAHFYRLDSVLEKLGYKRVIIGGPEDKGLADEFFSLGHSNALNLVGKTSITQTAAVLSQCALLVSADTGPLHLATAVGTSVIGLFGAADPKRTGPLGESDFVIQAHVSCVPCRKRFCKIGKNICMEEIRPEEVSERIIQTLGN